MWSDTDNVGLQTTCFSCFMLTATSCSGSHGLTDPLTPKPRRITCRSTQRRIMLLSLEYIPLLQKVVNRLRTNGSGLLRCVVGNRRRDVSSTLMEVTCDFESAPLTTPFLLQWQASPRHAMYSKTAHLSSAVSTFVFDTSWANSTSDIVGNRMWKRADPRTLRWFSGLTAIPRRWHSLLLHARHALNTSSSFADRLGNCTMFSSVLSATKI